MTFAGTNFKEEKRADTRYFKQCLLKCGSLFTVRWVLNKKAIENKEFTINDRVFYIKHVYHYEASGRYVFNYLD